jgi:hypothetical protein
MFVRTSACAALAVLLTGSVSASEYPMLDMAAQKVIQKYEQATCEQLWEQRGQPKTAEEQNVIQFLQGDPAMRTAFINEVAAPIANKLFSCGMIP